MKGVYDPTIPQALKSTQKWFASIISRPISYDSRINPIAPSGRPIIEEAPDVICASPTLEPYQRIEIYCQQYWWRLLKVLHDNHPLVTRLFGYTDFNQTIGVPFLAKYPPNHWSLNQLGDRLPQWIREEYRGEDKNLILDAARIDCAYMDSFGAARLPTLAIPSNPQNLERLLDVSLCHQPYLRLFSLKSPLFQFRDAFLCNDDCDHWLTRDFPPLPQMTSCVVLYRTTPHNHQVWKELPEAAYRYLSQFKRGVSINQSLEWVESQKGSTGDAIIANLRDWIQEWISLGWLARA